MKSMSGDIDYGVGPKTAKIRDAIDEIASWPGKIQPKPNLIVIYFNIFLLEITCDQNLFKKSFSFSLILQVYVVFRIL